MIPMTCPVGLIVKQKGYTSEKTTGGNGAKGTRQTAKKK
jgi:hypothetical protein